MFYFLRSLKFLITKLNDQFFQIFDYFIKESVFNRGKNKKSYNYFKFIDKLLSKKDILNQKCLVIDSKFNKEFDEFSESKIFSNKYIFFCRGNTRNFHLKKYTITKSDSEMINKLKKLDLYQFDIIIINNVLNKIFDENVYTFLKILTKKLNPKVKIYIKLNFSNKLYPKPFAQRYMPPKVWNEALKNSNNYTNTLVLEDFKNIIEDNGLKFIVIKEKFVKNKFHKIKKNINPIYWCHKEKELSLLDCILECDLK